MRVKPRHKRRILWTSISLCGAILAAYIIVPPIINLNRLKPRIENTISEQTGTSVKINGDVNISLLGHATIVAHDIDIGFGNISNMIFSIPLHYLFNLDNAPLNNNIDIYGGNFNIDSVEPFLFKYNITVNNSNVQFLNKTYNISRAVISNGDFTGTVRTNQHKYDIVVSDGNFIVKNNNNNLDIYGHLFPDGTANGHLYIETDNVNKWFEFSEPQIQSHIITSLDFNWDGKYGFEFTNIHANDITGKIVLYPDGSRSVTLRSNNLNYDMSFLMNQNNLFYETDFDLDFYGNIKIGKHTFKHLLVKGNGGTNTININNIIADNIHLSGGTITNNGAENVNLVISKNDYDTSCLFSGTPQNWGCNKFTYGDISGVLTVKNDYFTAEISSSENMLPIESLKKAFKPLGNNGIIHFSFSDRSGIIQINKNNINTTYTFAKDVSLTDIGINIDFLPEFMKYGKGNFTSENGAITFIPQTQDWSIKIDNHAFYITGNNFKQWLPNINLDFIKNMPYTASGKFNKDNIADLYILINEHVFNGSATRAAITLTTENLDLDKFINDEFIENFQELSFTHQHPIATLFDIPIEISLSANKFIYDGIEYNNFIYATKPNMQTISISDNARGNLLSIINKDKNEYAITAQINKFLLDSGLLTYDMPLNVYNSTVTGDIILKTNGKIADDIYYNMKGNINLTFEGGELIGFSFDDLYASTNSLTSTNAEFAISNILSGGLCNLKKLHIIGSYKDGIFKTTTPLTLTTRHTETTGILTIADNQINGIFNIILRGTSPNPTPIQLTLNPDGSRNYSLSEIMMNFDTGFMQTFIQTHNQF